MGKRNGGFSLIETLISIVILGAMVVPTCTALVMSIRLNDKTEKMLQAQLAVSSAVETLMAEGVTEAKEGYEAERFPDVYIVTEQVIENGAEMPYYSVVVSDVPAEGGDALVTVSTTIRAAETAQTGGGGE